MFYLRTQPPSFTEICQLAHPRFSCLPWPKNPTRPLRIFLGICILSREATGWNFISLFYSGRGALITPVRSCFLNPAAPWVHTFWCLVHSFIWFFFQLPHILTINLFLKRNILYVLLKSWLMLLTPKKIPNWYDVTLFLQMRRLTYREVKELVPSHTTFR